MMINELLKNRVSALGFESGQIDQDTIENLISAATRTPTAFNLQNWHFTVMQSDEARQALCKAAYGQAKILDAAAVIVISGDLTGYRHLAERLDASVQARLLPAEVAEGWVQVATQAFHDNPQAQRDEAIRSASLAAMSLMLAATEAGWASCPMSGFDPDAVREACVLPDNLLPVLLVAIGRRAQPDQQQKHRVPLSEVMSVR